jgi:hypothetical protein
MSKRFTIALWIILAGPASAQSRSRRPITVNGSRPRRHVVVNGRWLAYGVSRVNEENETPHPPAGPRHLVLVPNGTGATFSVDSRWVAYLIGVSPATRERLEREHKPIRTALGIRELSSGRSDSIAEIASFRFSADGRFIAMRRYPGEGKRVAELIVQSLATGARMTFGSVGDFAWTDRRPVLALTIETEGGTGNAVQVYDAMTQTVRVDRVVGLDLSRPRLAEEERRPGGVAHDRRQGFPRHDTRAARLVERLECDTHAARDGSSKRTRVHQWNARR